MTQVQCVLTMLMGMMMRSTSSRLGEACGKVWGEYYLYR